MNHLLPRGRVGREWLILRVSFASNNSGFRMLGSPQKQNETLKSKKRSHISEYICFRDALLYALDKYGGKFRVRNDKRALRNAKKYSSILSWMRICRASRGRLSEEDSEPRKRRTVCLLFPLLVAGYLQIDKCILLFSQPTFRRALSERRPSENFRAHDRLGAPRTNVMRRSPLGQKVAVG